MIFHWKIGIVLVRWIKYDWNWFGDLDGLAIGDQANFHYHIFGTIAGQRMTIIPLVLAEETRLTTLNHEHSLNGKYSQG